MSKRSRVPARVAATLALIGATVALLVIIASAQQTSSEGSKKATTEQTEVNRPRKARYVVKEGDTLLGIAAKTGVSIERLQELNPEIDPQVLQAGQRIKLR